MISSPHVYLYALATLATLQEKTFGQISAEISRYVGRDTRENWKFFSGVPYHDLDTACFKVGSVNNITELRKLILLCNSNFLVY